MGGFSVCLFFCFCLWLNRSHWFSPIMQIYISTSMKDAQMIQSWIVWGKEERCEWNINFASVHCYRVSLVLYLTLWLWLPNLKASWIWYYNAKHVLQDDLKIVVEAHPRVYFITFFQCFGNYLYIFYITYRIPFFYKPARVGSLVKNAEPQKSFLVSLL